MITTLIKWIFFPFLWSGWKRLAIKWNGSPRKLRAAIKKADKLCSRNKKRYRVYFLGGKFQALSRNQIQDKKHSGEWNRNVNVTKLERVEFFDTLNGITEQGKKALTVRKAYNH